MVALDISAAEKAGGRLTEAHRKAAVAAIRDDGFVVLNDVVNVADLEMLRERMLEDLERLLAREDAPFNWNTGNVQQDPPPFPPYLCRDVLLNDLVVDVTAAVLGKGVKNSYYSGNTALPGGQMQPVHPDGGQLWPDLEVATPAFGLIVNVPVVDMDANNGSTELWPGTHKDATMSVQRGDIKVPEALVEARRKVAPPLQPSVGCGGVLIRDNRLWHRGMPNHTDKPRPMIAMIHFIHWWDDRGETLTFPKGTEEFFRHPVLRTNARFVEGPIDYIHHPQSYDFQK